MTKQIFKYMNEAHVMLHASSSHTTQEQIAELQSSLNNIQSEEGLSDMTPVFIRYFLSDAANQLPLLRELGHKFQCATSVVEQPPLDGTKIAAWVYLMSGVTVDALDNGYYKVSESQYTHILRASSATPDIEDSEDQTYQLLSDYAQWLRNYGMTLKDNCVRTWFFVHDIDINYKGVVTGRNSLFAKEGLTATTHFIASTGIGGSSDNHKTKVLMDTFAINGIGKNDMGYLYAKSHLNPTYEYGVAFERGAYVDFHDKRRIYISGTASIDNKGNILHPGDVSRQALRMLENVEMLLSEGSMTYDNVGHMIVYLRDIADYNIINELFQNRFPHKPYVIVLAPVCRPGWLIEMECMAVKQL
ncbi:MAG: hypothetical protein HUJ96_09430 [Marinilabiliaceae bacterium]|nr:hypothetical protein [Marinilabiliaceae bacterium]